MLGTSSVPEIFYKFIQGSGHISEIGARPDMVVHALIPAFGRQRRADLFEMEASTVYIASSGGPFKKKFF